MVCICRENSGQNRIGRGPALCLGASSQIKCDCYSLESELSGAAHTCCEDGGLPLPGRPAVRCSPCSALSCIHTICVQSLD